MHQLLLLVSIMNIAAGVCIASFFVWDKMKPQRSTTEPREVIVLLLESFSAALSLWAVISAHPYYWLGVVQYLVFAVHAILLLLFIVFMFTFKIKKLF